MTPTRRRWSPVTVATVRGIALAAASAALGTVVIVAGQVKAETLVPLVPPWLLFLRYLEGVVDKARGQVDQVPGGGATSPDVELEQVGAIADELVDAGWQPPTTIIDPDDPEWLAKALAANARGEVPTLKGSATKAAAAKSSSSSRRR